MSSEAAAPSQHGPVVLAFGGNALLPDPFQPEMQEERARALARAVLLLIGRSSGLVLVHGNGPQVGMILLRVEATRAELPPEPLDMLVAETQGSIGYLLSRALRNALGEEGGAVDVTPILTQVVVDPDDQAFERPSKPIGPFYSPAAARQLMDERGWRMVEVADEGWRRVVASPRPLRVVEIAPIAAAARGGQVVIAGGGGGIPVRDDPGRGLAGVEAVIDKDRTAALLARSLEAEAFVVLTGVAHVFRDFGSPAQERIERMTAGEARALLRRGAFPPGSMAPKIEAACDYTSGCGRPTVITDTAHLAEALEGRSGTWIVRGGERR